MVAALMLRHLSRQVEELRQTVERERISNDHMTEAVVELTRVVRQRFPAVNVSPVEE